MHLKIIPISIKMEVCIMPSLSERINLLDKCDLLSDTGDEVLYNCQVQDNTKMIATCDLSAGIIVYQGHPILSYKSDAGKSTEAIFVALNFFNDFAIEDLYERVKDLYPKTLEEMLAEISKRRKNLNIKIIEEMCTQKEHQIIAKINCNAFALGDRKCLYYTGSKFNHSCYPNCLWDKTGEIMTMRTIREVKMGEELTHCYPGCLLEKNVNKRRKVTLIGGLFRCTCNACTDNKIFHFMACDNCGNDKAKLMICSGCKSSRYCSQECQRSLWSKHKIICKKSPHKFCYCPSCLIESYCDHVFEEKHPKCHFQ